MRKTAILLVFSTFTLITACESEKEALVIPNTYNAANFSTNASTELQVLVRLTELVNETKKGRTAGISVSNSNLTALYNAGNPTLKSLNTTYYASRLEGTNGFLAELSKASGTTYTPGAPTGEGGVFGGYLFDENGLELEQLIEKGQFGSVLYHHATKLLSAELDNTTSDKVLAILGSNPSFPNSSDATKHEQPDKLAAVYAARRDKNDGNGFYTQLKNSFIKLQVAIAAGNEYEAEQQQAVKEIKETWEKVNAATIINYCHTVISTMSATSPTDAQKANALHAYGEAVGFTHGWRTIPQQHKIITDTEIDEILVLLNAPFNATPTSYLFITDPVNQLPKLQQVISKLKSIYGFTDQQIEDFKKNWVSEQQR